MSRTIRFLRLFHMLLAKRAAVDVEKIQAMGLLAVKIAQMYAVRSDIIGVEKAQALAALLQRNLPAAAVDFRARLDAVANEELKRNLDWLDDEPLAVASLGQVHRGRLASGEEVIVKVTRDDFEEDFRRDVAALRRLLKIGLAVYPKLEGIADPLGVLEVVESMTIREMDLRNELSGGEQLLAIRDAAKTRLQHFRQLRLPRVFAKYTNRDVLVAEFIVGKTINDLLAAGQMTYDHLLTLFRIQGYCLFHQGVFHGDLHPGNVIVDSAGDFWFIDNANIEVIPRHFAAGMMIMLSHIAEDEIPEAARALSDLSTAKLAPGAYAAYEGKFVELYREFPGKTVSEVSMTQQMMATVKMAVRSGLDFPKGSFPLIKSLMYLDGMVVQANPGAILLKDVARFVPDFQAA